LQQAFYARQTGLRGTASIEALKSDSRDGGRDGENDDFKEKVNLSGTVYENHLFR
jgi:hypothetical protein